MTIVIESEAGKINPNTAQPELLAALLHQVGVDTGTAAGIANAIADWRFPGARARPGGAKAAEYRAAGRDYGPPGKPFERLDELGLVLGVTPELLARLTSHLTLYHEGEPDIRAAGPIVWGALREAAGTPPVPPSGPMDETTVVIAAVATGENATGGNGARFARQAVIRMNGRASEGALFTILEWGRSSP